MKASVRTLYMNTHFLLNFLVLHVCYIEKKLGSKMKQRLKIEKFDFVLMLKIEMYENNVL